MNAAALTLIAPAIAGLLLLLIRRSKRVVAWLGVGLTLIVALVVAAANPATIAILGRTLAFTGQLRTVLLFFYVILSLLALVAVWLPQGPDFVALSLLVSAALSGALMIEPFVFGAVFLAIGAGGLTVMAQGSSPGPTLPALRVQVVTLIAMALLLIAGWMLELSQGPFLNTVALFFAVAYIILLAGFPFHFWIAPLFRRAPPLVSVFTLGLVHWLVAFFCLQLLTDNPAVHGNGLFFNLMLASGIASIAVAGLLALTSQTMGGLVGYLMLIDAGTVVFTLGFSDLVGLETVLLMLQARIVALLAIALALALRRPTGNAENGHPNYNYDVVSMSLLVIGTLSLIGLPLTPGFSGRYTALTLIGSRSVWLTLPVLAGLALGALALVRAVLRILASGTLTFELSIGPRPDVRQIGAGAILVAVILLGLYPRPLLVLAYRLASLF